MSRAVFEADGLTAQCWYLTEQTLQGRDSEQSLIVNGSDARRAHRVTTSSDTEPADQQSRH